MLWNLQDESLNKKVVARVLEAKGEGREQVIGHRFLESRHLTLKSLWTEW